MMKCIALVHKGVEDIASGEIKEILNIPSKIIDSAIIFDVGSYHDICKICYLSQSLRRVILVKQEREFNSLDDMKNIAKTSDFSDWLGKNKTFSMRCIKSEEMDISSHEIETVVGGEIKDNTHAKVDLENPGILLVSYVTKNRFIIGVDFSGFDMSKRDYNIFSVQKSFKGGIAYSLSKLVGFHKGKVLLDPFCGSGAIPIESALFISGRSPEFYIKDKFMFLRYKKIGIDFDSVFIELDKQQTNKDKTMIFACDPLMPFVKSSQKNAKIAGVSKLIKFSRMDYDWLDTRFGEESIDCVVTAVPNLTKHEDEKKIIGIYDEFFKQMKIVLKISGRMVIVCNTAKIKDISEKYGFLIQEEREIMQGKSKLQVLVFSK